MTDTMRSQFALVRREPSAAMEAAHFDAHAKSEQVFASVPEVWSAMLSASEPPTDQELDEMCRCMWGDKWWWQAEYDFGEFRTLDRQATYQDADRGTMRAFLSAIQGDAS